MNKEEVLTRFYADKLIKDYEMLLRIKSEKIIYYGKTINENDIDSYVSGPEEYKRMLLGVLKSNGYFNPIL